MYSGIVPTLVGKSLEFKASDDWTERVVVVELGAST
jgi:hypothetical protein